MIGFGDFFFFKQKTAYEMLRSLVGSEMCIRDRLLIVLGSKTQLTTFQRLLGEAVDLSLIHI